MAEPAYLRVYHALRNEIVKKQYNVGSVLPPEPELEKEYGVSRTTVRKAIDMLVREGFLCVRQGFGTQVISCKAVQNMNKFTSVSESLRKKGYKIGLQSCYIERVGASKEIAGLLGVKASTPLICVHRIKTADGRPMSLTENYILEQMVPGLDMHAQLPNLYEYLEDTFGITYTGSKDLISACNATFEQANLLGVEPNSALLHIRRVCFQGTRPCEVDNVYLVADMYEFEIFTGDRN